MVRLPPVTESTDSITNRMVHDLAALNFEAPQAEARAEIGRPGRELCLYPGKLGYELQEELDFLGLEGAADVETAEQHDADDA